MSSATPATCAGSRPKLSRVTMYAPPAVGYALIVCRYDRIRNASTTSSAIVIGTTSANAATPTAGIEHPQDLLGRVRRRREVVGCEHRERGRLAEPLVHELLGRERTARAAGS